MNFGTYILTNITDCNCSKLNDIEYIKQTAINIILKENLEIRGISAIKNDVLGISCFVLTPNLHLMVRTYPEYKTATVDIYLSSENNDFHYKILQHIKDELDGKMSFYDTVERM